MFVLPSNNKLNVEPIDESPQKLGFNRSYSKIDNFSIMQTKNILSLMDYKLKVLVCKIPEMKHVSISSINSTLTELRSFISNFWFPMKIILFFDHRYPNNSKYHIIHFLHVVPQMFSKW